MADKIGVLGETTLLTAQVHAVYTVPASKAARFKIMYRIKGNSDGSTDFDITVNGIVILTHTNIGASGFLFSTPNAMLVDGDTTVPTGVDGDTTVSPGPVEFFMSAGDVMSYTIGGAVALACNVQAVGVEIDV